MMRAAGLLGKGSVLLVTSRADRTAPTLRGKWILENLLGVPPPPPPPNVPALEPTPGTQPKTMRERLDVHRANPACAGCHRLTDPLGFSMENFNAVGAWRTRDAGAPVDAGGALPDGTPLHGVAELRAALLKHPETFCPDALAEAADLCPGTRPSGVRSAGRPGHRARRRGRGLSFLVVRARHREERTVPDAPEIVGRQDVGRGSRSSPGITVGRVFRPGETGRGSDVRDETCATPSNDSARSRHCPGTPVSRVDGAGRSSCRPEGASPLRFGAVYVPNGMPIKDWMPTTKDGTLEITPVLKPLEPLREHVTVYGNLTRAGGRNATDHAVSSAGWLSGVVAKRTEAEDISLGVTIDQVLARHIGQDTPFPSLEFATEDFAGYIGGCVPGYSCTYMNTISWGGETSPLPMEINPRVAFERMFGRAGDPAARITRSRRTGAFSTPSGAEARALQQRVTPADRVRLDAYLDNVREIERRIARSESRNASGRDAACARSASRRRSRNMRR
jgi:hypothetical protein